jgi:hypothetical protein
VNRLIALSDGEVAVYYALRAPGLRQRGKRWREPCPIHRGEHDSFSVDPETGLWRCWSVCGRGGDIIALEIALTGAPWREAVAAVEQVIGRNLIDRPATRVERRAAIERRRRDQSEMRDAVAWRIAIECMAEEVLEELPEAVPERYGPTQLLLCLRAARGSDLLPLYRDYCEREPRLTAALVYSGARAWKRLCDRLARFIIDADEVNDAA